MVLRTPSHGVVAEALKKQLQTKKLLQTRKLLQTTSDDVAALMALMMVLQKQPHQSGVRLAKWSNQESTRSNLLLLHQAPPTPLQSSHLQP